MKSNPSINVMILIATLCHTITQIHIKYLKREEPNPVSQTPSPVGIRQLINRSISPENLFR